ncbi:MAG: hypothetical protein IBJ18_03040 [Phycisphaerales bacterium]|nr:hypothetical protein [Phycisphaerales bacterium]
MIPLPHLNPSPIGIDITKRGIHLAQAITPADPLSPVRTAFVPRAADATPQSDAQLVANLLDRRDFVSRRVVIAAPGDSAFSAVLDLPPRSSAAPVDQLAAIELARSHKLDPKDITVATWQLPLPTRAGEPAKHMAVALPSAAGERLVAAFESEGLFVEAIDARALAMARALTPHPDDEGCIIPILCADWHRASLTAVFQGEVFYERALETARFRALDAAVQATAIDSPAIIDEMLAGSRSDGSALEPTLAQLASSLTPLVISHAAELVDQLRLSLAYVAQLMPQAGLSRIELMGELACVPTLGQAIADALQLEVTLPDRAIVGSASITHRAALGPALGLSLLNSRTTPETAP